MPRDLGFADLGIAFDFSRPVPAPFVNAAGVIEEAPPGWPRRNFDESGSPIGLIVEAGSYLGAADRLVLDPLMLPDDSVGEEATVLHTLAIDGAIVRRAWYTRDAKAMLDSLLLGEGQHVLIGVLAGHRPNRGGYVRYRGQSWDLPDLLRIDGKRLLGDQAGRPLTGG